jgi:hypothetical protein
MKALTAVFFLLCLTQAASAQYWHGYGGYSRPWPSCGYYGCYAQRRYAWQAPRPVYRPPVRYQWYGGPPRAYLGGRGGGWGGEW